jgi:hypothetical protein
MNEFDARVFDLLDAFTPEPKRWPDWQDVLGRTRARHTRRLVVAIAAAVGVLGCAAGVTAALGGFDAWLSGSPGKPAPKAEQKRFRSANEQSYFGFPKDTKLRELIRTTVDGKLYVLFGFRSGESLCLRLKAVSLGHSIGPGCAPAARLRHASAPILPVIPNFSFADKHNHPSAATSFGTAADGLSKMIVHAVDGDHRAALAGNAYLWVQDEPNSGQRALSVTAVSSAGTRVTLPFEEATAPNRHARGPDHVQARIAHPTVGWYIRGEKRGVGHMEINRIRTDGRGFIDDSTRFVRPDPDSNVLVGLTGRWCLLVAYGRSGPSASCSSGDGFWSQGPLNWTMTGEYSDQFMRINGVAADGVRRVVIFLADGQRQRTALRDNLFTTLVATSEFPARIIGYDEAGRVVGVITLPTPFLFNKRVPAAATRLRPVFRVRAPRGAAAVARVGRAAGGYRCWRVDFSTSVSRDGCESTFATGPWIWVDLVQPAGDDLFVVGHTRAPITRVQLEFPNGDVRRSRPVAGLFVIAVPRGHLSTERQTAFVRGYSKEGWVIQRQGVVFKVRR